MKNEKIFEASNTLFETALKQADALYALNQKQLDALTQQLEAARTNSSQAFAQLKKDTELRLESSKETIQDLAGAYGKVMTETLESNREMVKEINSQMNRVLTNSFKTWSELFNPAESGATKEMKTPAHSAAATETEKKSHVAKN